MRPSRLIAAVERALRELGTPSADQTIVVGVSGGPDSVALLDALTTLGPKGGFRVVAAHLDHSLRSGSAQDAAFSARLCADLGVKCWTARADVRGRARREGGGIEEAARGERYAFLRTVKEKEGAVAIAVAHTRDDQAETFLLRLLRGAGSPGLSCMHPRSGDLIRPLLRVSREEVLDHLRPRGLSWREDPSNADVRILRNRVRHELLPYLERRFNPAIRQALARTASLLADEAEVLRERAERMGPRSRAEGEGVSLDRSALVSARKAEARQAIRQALAKAGGLRGVSAPHVERVLDLACSKAPSGRRLPLPGRREAIFRFDRVYLGPSTRAVEPFSLPLPVPGAVDLPGGLRLLARSERGPAVSNAERAVVAVPDGPLFVRTRKPGDRVRTNRGEVSLRRFLMGRRVPADLRAGLPLVAAGSRVLWVPGQTMGSGGGEGGRFVGLELKKAEDAADPGGPGR